MTALILLKITVVFAAALAAAAALRKSTAACRHLVLSTAVVVSLVLPIAQDLLPTWQLLPAAAPESDTVAVLHDADEATSAAMSAGMVPRIAMSAPSSRPSPAFSSAWLPALWLCGCAFFLLRLVFGIFAVERAARRSGPAGQGNDQACLDALRDSLGIRRRVVLRQTSDSMPAAWGFIRPIILLPDAAAGWPAARRRDVIAHELGHVARGDVPVLLLARLACAIYWFHPLAWLVVQRLGTEAERAADDLALSTGSRPTRYAEHLLTTATEFNHHYRVAPVMAARTQLEQRIMAILATTTNRTATTRVTRVFVLATAALCLAGLSTIGWSQSGDAGATVSTSIDRLPISGQSDSADFGAHLAKLGIRKGDVDALIAGLASSDALTRGASAWALGDSTDPRVVEPLVQAGYDSDARVRQWALRSLARWPQPAVAALQVDRLQDTDAEVRQWAARGLAAQDAATRAQPLVGALADSDAEVREWAVRGLAGVDDPNVSTALAAMLASEPDAAVSEWLIRTLPTGGANNRDALAIGLQSPHAEVRQWAVRGLDASADDRANDLLIGMLGDSDPEVREWSARGLSFCGNERAVAPLEGLSADSDADVREWAEKSLAAIACAAQARVRDGQ